MCFFERDNPNKNSLSYKLGVEKFACGVCPECLAKKARYWALRCGAESQVRKGIMITLTYDDYLYNNGRIVGEKTPNKDLKCNVEHCQLFMKRLRKWVVDSRKKKKFPLYKARPRFEKKARKICKKLPHGERAKAQKKYVERKLDNLRRRNKRIEEYNRHVDQKANVSYLLTAEHGKRTNRAHYHSIIFGVDFKDKVPYKKSDRGNMIYKSKTLTKLWGHGICTIDAVNITGQVARYCTKYCAKDSRCDDTFMLMSRGIGDEWLLKNFNGKSYILDGREYTIPKLIWNKYIENAYKNNYIFKKMGVTYKYRSFDWYLNKIPDEYYTPENVQIAMYCANMQKKRNHIFGNFKRMNSKFQAYLEYWKKKAELYNLKRPSVRERIQALKNDKYFFYKQKALYALDQQVIFGKCVVPRSGKSSVVKYKGWNFCADPLVIKAQMTPKKENTFIKTVYWVKEVQDFVYLRPVKV